MMEAALHRVASRARGTSDVFRIAVVEFASRARVSVPPVEFRHDAQAPGALDQLVASAAARIGRLSDLGDEKNIDDFLTDTPAALALARRQIQEMVRADPSPDRRQFIVLLTDGRPYRSKTSYEQVFREAADHLRAALAEGVDQIRVLGINDIGGSDLGYWQQGDGKRWEEIVGPGLAERVDPVADKLPRRIQAIMDELLGTDSSATLGNAFALGPYESRLSVTVTLDRATAKLPVLVLPGGATVQPSYPGPGPDQSRARSVAYDVPNPRQGNYSIRFDRDSLGRLVTGQVARSLTHARASLISPGTLVAGRKADLQFRAVGASDSDVLAFDPIWPVKSASARITSVSDQISETVPLTWDASSVLSGQWTPPKPGAFTFAVEGMYAGPNASDGAQPLFATEASAGQITVVDHPPFNLVPVQTAADTLSVSPLGAQSVALRFRLQESGAATPADIASFLSEPDDFARLQVLDESGHAIAGVQPVLLKREGEELVAQVAVRFRWLTGEGWMPGRHSKTLLVGLIPNDGAIAAGRAYGGVEIPAGSGLTRVRSLDPKNSVGGFRVVGSAWVLVAAVLLVLALVGVVAALFGRRLLLTRLEDSRRERAVKLVFFQPGAGAFVGPGAKSFDVTSRGRLNLDRQVQLRVDGGLEFYERLRVRRLQGDDRTARAELRLRPRNSKHEHVLQLRSGDGRPPTPLPGKTGEEWSVVLMLEPLRRRR